MLYSYTKSERFSIKDHSLIYKIWQNDDRHDHVRSYQIVALLYTRTNYCRQDNVGLPT